MLVTCPACQLSIESPRVTPGLRVSCPGCGEKFRVQADNEIVDAEEVWEDDSPKPEPKPPAAAKPLPKESAESEGPKKTCPMCGEQIAIAARRCRFCGEPLAGLQGEDGYSIEGVWREGKLLVMRKDALLPAMCVQTNQPTSERLPRQLHWHTPWLYLALLAGLIGIIVYVVVALFVRESANISIGLSRDRIVRRRWMIFAAWMGSLLGIVLCIGGGVTASNHSAGDEAVAALWISGLVLCLGSMITGILMARIVTAAKITSRFAWIKGVHPDYLAALPTFPGE
jgi:hypothetical protein